MSSIPMLNFRQVSALVKAVGDKRTILVMGENGVGKTSLLNAARADRFYSDFIIPDAIECQQLAEGSLYMPDVDREVGVSRELPNERFGLSRKNRRGIPGAKPVLLMLDELCKARAHVQDELAPVIYDRRMGEAHFPEGSRVVATTNLEIEGLGDSLKPHMRSRVVVVRMRKPTQQEWVSDFAVPNGLSPELVAATHFHPTVFDSFLDYEPGGKYHGRKLASENAFIFDPRSCQESYVNPRSLHAASDILLSSASLDDDTLLASLAGAVGAPFAVAMQAFIMCGREIPLFEEVVDSPTNVRVPKNITAQCVQVFQFVSKASTRTECAAVLTYVGRLQAEMQVLFASAVATSSKFTNYCSLKDFAPLLERCNVVLSV